MPTTQDRSSDVPTATSLPLCISLDSSSHQTYRLMELSDDVAKLIEEAQQKHVEQAQHKRGISHQGISSADPEKKRTEPEWGEDRPHSHPNGLAAASLVINGRNQDEAVLCTSSRTYALREVTQSNSLLLCSIDAYGGEPGSSRKAALSVRSNCSSVFELLPTVPRLERITSLLRNSMFEGKDVDDKVNQRRYTPQEVRSVVQASDAELKQGCEDRHVVLLDGHLRLVSPAYLKTVLRSLILILEANSYLPHKVPLAEASHSLLEDHAGSLRVEVAEAILTRWFGKLRLVSDEEGGGEPAAPAPTRSRAKIEAVELDGQRIARFFGEELLKEASQKRLASGQSVPTATTHEEFMSSWRSLIGDSFFPDPVSLSLLQGQYLLHPAPPARSCGPPLEPLTISYYPAHQLPLDPTARFQELFLTRPSWTLEDLEPFIRDMAVDPKRREALLIKYARTNKVKVPGPSSSSALQNQQESKKDTSQPKEVTVYSARLRY